MSLISATKPAQALSIYSNSYSHLTSPSSYSLLNSQPSGFGQSDGGFNSPRLLSNGSFSEIEQSADALEIMMIMGMLILASLGLDTGGGGGETNLLSANLQTDPGGSTNTDGGTNNGGGSNGGGNGGGGVVDPVTPVPTPALLSGLLGMGIASIRKRSLAEAD